MSSGANMISCLTWVKRGVAKRHPDRVRLAENDIALLMKGDAGDDDGSDDSWEDEPDDVDESDIDKKYNLAGYDSASNKNSSLSMAAVACFSSDSQDPYFTKGKNEGSDVDSEYEEMEIMPDDNLLVLGKVCDDYFKVEVRVYNEADDNLYCHRDSSLPAFPLAMEWLDFDPGEEQAGNFVAVGSVESNIDIWDLDVVDSLEPAFVLSGVKRKGKKKQHAAGHTDAVLDLSWNRLQRHVLASASADFTVGLWDLRTGAMASQIEAHAEKVQCVQWHPVEGHTLLSGGFDRELYVNDCRAADARRSWTLPGEVERAFWNHLNPYYILASTDTGHVVYVDTRCDRAVFTLAAHTAAVSGLALSSGLGGCFLTASADRTAKLWDIRDHREPHLVLEKDLKMGALQCAACCPDATLIFAVAGEREFRIVNLHRSSVVSEYFGTTVGGQSKNGGDADVTTAGVDAEQLTAVRKEVTKKSKKKIQTGGKKSGE